jgi:hypothetical protein
MKTPLILLLLSLAIAPASAQVIRPPTITTNPTISTLTTGTVLDVTPSVSPDGRYVTLKTRPQFSTLDGFDTFTSGGSGNPTKTAVAVAMIPYRPMQVGKITFVDNDKKLLAQEIAPVTFSNISLKDATRKLAAQTKTNLVLGIRGLENAAVDLVAPHTFTLEKSTLKDALVTMIKTAAPEVDIVITSDDGVVEIMSQAQADHQVITRTYFVQDLLQNLPRFVSNETDLATLNKLKDSQPEEKPAPKNIPATGAGVLPPAVARTANAPKKTDNNTLYQAVPNNPEPAPQKSSTTIQEIITSAIRPEIWKSNGGKTGEIAVVGDRVTITAPTSVHALLDGPKTHNPNAVPMYVNYGTR